MRDKNMTHLISETNSVGHIKFYRKFESISTAKRNCLRLENVNLIVSLYQNGRLFVEI